MRRGGSVSRRRLRNRPAWARAHTCAYTFALSMALLPMLSVHAQPSAKKFRIGFRDTGQSLAVPKLLTDLGYIDGQNAVFEHRSSQAQPERAAEMAADLVRSKVACARRANLARADQ